MSKTYLLDILYTILSLPRLCKFIMIKWWFIKYLRPLRNTDNNWTNLQIEYQHVMYIREKRNAKLDECQWMVRDDDLHRFHPFRSKISKNVFENVSLCYFWMFSYCILIIFFFYESRWTLDQYVFMYRRHSKSILT